MISLILTLCVSALSQAESLIVISGEGQLDHVPQTIFTSLQDSGATVLGEEDMRSLEVSALECKQSEAGKLDCSFALEGNEARHAVKNNSELFQALRELDESESGLNLGSCKQGSCEFKLGAITCMENLSLGEDVPGKFGCSFVTL